MMPAGAALAPRTRVLDRCPRRALDRRPYPRRTVGPTGQVTAAPGGGTIGPMTDRSTPSLERRRHLVQTGLRTAFHNLFRSTGGILFVTAPLLAALVAWLVLSKLGHAHVAAVAAVLCGYVPMLFALVAVETFTFATEAGAIAYFRSLAIVSGQPLPGLGEVTRLERSCPFAVVSNGDVELATTLALAGDLMQASGDAHATLYCANLQLLEATDDNATEAGFWAHVFAAAERDATGQLVLGYTHVGHNPTTGRDEMVLPNIATRRADAEATFAEWKVELASAAEATLVPLPPVVARIRALSDVRMVQVVAGTGDGPPADAIGMTHVCMAPAPEGMPSYVARGRGSNRGKVRRVLFTAPVLWLAKDGDDMGKIHDFGEAHGASTMLPAAFLPLEVTP